MAVGNEGSAHFPAGKTGQIQGGSTPVGNPATQPSGKSGSIPTGGSTKVGN